MRTIQLLFTKRKELTATTNKVKPILIGMAVFVMVALGAITGLPIGVSHSLGIDTAIVAYADGCDGIGPQPDLDCPITATATPTATPDPNR